MAADEKARRRWHRDYIAALLERDLKDIARIHRLDAMRELVRVMAAYEGATSASVAGLAALAYAADAAAFLTEAYVHPGPRMPPPETGRDDLAPGLAHAIVAILIYALLARRRRCCESKQRSGKRE